MRSCAAPRGVARVRTKAGVGQVEPPTGAITKSGRRLTQTPWSQSPRRGRPNQLLLTICKVRGQPAPLYFGALNYTLSYPKPRVEKDPIMNLTRRQLSLSILTFSVALWGCSAATAPVGSHSDGGTSATGATGTGTSTNHSSSSSLSSSSATTSSATSGSSQGASTGAATSAGTSASTSGVTTSAGTSGATTNAGTSGSTTSSSTSGTTTGASTSGGTGGGCPSGQTLCGTTCVDLQSNGSHCGACSTVCGGSTSVCANGVCASACPAALVTCSSSCVNLATDPANCGSCGAPCLQGTSCVSGQCTCGAGLVACGPGVGCYDTSSDPNNCGACGRACLQGELCSAGLCVCVPGFATCSVNSTCQTQTSSSSQDCGGCGNICSMLSQFCDTGNCVSTCAGTICPGPGTGRFATSLCVNTTTDIANCGNCGNQCANNEVCVSGACQTYAPVTDVGCSTCPCAACDGTLGFVSCCTQPGYGNICVDARTCP